MDQFHFLSASQLAESTGNGGVSSFEVFKAWVNQISKHNPKVNAMVTLDEEKAIQRAYWRTRPWRKATYCFSQSNNVRKT
jgi:amidase